MKETVIYYDILDNINFNLVVEWKSCGGENKLFLAHTRANLVKNSHKNLKVYFIVKDYFILSIYLYLVFQM